MNVSSQRAGQALGVPSQLRCRRNAVAEEQHLNKLGACFRPAIVVSRKHGRLSIVLKFQAGRARPCPLQCARIVTRRQQQAHARAVGLDFVEDPHGFGYLVVLGVVLEAQQDLMREHLRMSGAAWDTEEECKVSLAALCGANYERQVRALVAHKGELESRFVGRMGELLQSGRLQACLKTSHQVSHMRTLAFRLVSSAAGLCHQLLVAPHQRFPLRTFAMAREGGEESFATKLGQVRPCLFDEWTRSLVDHYQGRLDTPEAKADIAATSLLAQLETAQIEAKHSSIRRRLVKASVQTHVQQVQHTSADFCFSHLARERRRLEILLGQIAHAPPSANVDEPPPETTQGPPRPLKRGGGGPWRAFVHEQCAGRQKADLGALGVEYRALPPDRLAELASLGAAGTLAHRLGHASFGATGREAARARHKRLRAAEQADASSRARAALQLECGIRQDTGDQQLALTTVAGTSSAIVRAMVGWEAFMITSQAVASQMDAARRARQTELSVALGAWAMNFRQDGHPLEGLLPAEAARALLPQPLGGADLRHWRWFMDDTMRSAAHAVSVRGEAALGKALQGALRQD